MMNLYGMEQLALDRQMEMRREPVRHSLVRQAANARDGRVGQVEAGSSMRSSLGHLLIRLGLSLSKTAGTPKPAVTPRCVCVPVND